MSYFFKKIEKNSERAAHVAISNQGLCINSKFCKDKKEASQCTHDGKTTTDFFM
jgi:hypothetical protein